MIHTNELMLGNWVEYATGLNGEKRSIPMYVKAIDEDEALLSFNGNEADPFVIEDKELLGIPFTDELIKKCGYEFDFELENIKVYIKNGKYVTLKGDTLYFTMNRGRYQVKYLHEFQNLYFFLTKEHLEVKL